MLFGALSLALVACGNEEMLDGPGENPGGEQSRITIAVSTPASEGVLVRGMQTRATVADETEESAVNSLNVFLFKKDAGDTDADYKYYDTYSFGTGQVNGELTDGGNGSKSCAIDIDKELMGATVKIALSANDKGTMTLEKGTTTLDTFKKALATAVASNGDKADVLVGGEASKSFPMSCLVSEAKELTSLGVDVEATLVRNVARLDIFNYTPNLKITAVRMENVNDKSCLFGAKGTLNVPATDLNKIGLSPLKEFSDKLDAGLTYQTPDQETEESAREKNTHRVSYLYEQAVTDEGSSPVITIEYILSIAGEEQVGSVNVKFQKTTEPKDFVNVDRNTLYRIKLGDGKNVGAGNVKAQFEVVDWIEGEDINSDLDPGTEGGDQNGLYPDAALGDIMLSDGTLVHPDDITEEQKAQAIGVVAFLYKDQSRVGQSVKTKLGRDATGLVLALKELALGHSEWALTSKEVIGTSYDKLGNAYAESFDGYDISQKMLTGDKDLKNDYIVFYELQKYRQSHPTPSATTEWYLPSFGEWADLLSTDGLGGVDIQPVKDNMANNSTTIPDISITVIDALNAALEVVGSDNINEFYDSHDYYWSSSECDESNAYGVNFNAVGDLYFGNDDKTGNGLARCIFAF